MKKNKIKKWEEMSFSEKVQGAVSLVVMVAVIVGVFQGITESFNETQSLEKQPNESIIADNNIVEAETQVRKNEYTVLSGVERDEYSAAFGELVVKEINLWEGTGNNRGKVVGKVLHNTKVEIIDQKEDVLIFYKVRTQGSQEGWVSEMFVTDIVEE